MKSNSKRITVKPLIASFMHGHVHTIWSHNTFFLFIYLFTFISLAVLPNPPRQFRCGRKPEYPEKTQHFRQNVFKWELGLCSH